MKRFPWTGEGFGWFDGLSEDDTFKVDWSTREITIQIAPQPNPTRTFYRPHAE